MVDLSPEALMAKRPADVDAAIRRELELALAPALEFAEAGVAGRRRVAKVMRDLADLLAEQTPPTMAERDRVADAQAQRQAKLAARARR